MRCAQRLCAAVFLWAMCLLLMPAPALAISTSASAAVLLDAQSGRILYAVNEQEEMLIASTTKIMTALVALRHYDLSASVVIPRSVTLTEGSSLYLREGERITVEELLYGLLLASGNDAAEALAGFCGSRATFVRWMNETAAELGLCHTSFANPSGLDDEKQYSSAYDLACLTVYALREPAFRRIVSTQYAVVGTRTLQNHNRLLRECAGCVGVKTGFTKAAGRTLVSAAERNGRLLVAVTLRDGNDWADHKALYDYGFLRVAEEAMPGELPAFSASAGLRIPVPARCRLPICFAPPGGAKQMAMR